MRLTTYTDYTLRVLMYFALHPGRIVTVGEIARAYDVSAAHLAKVVQRLALAGEIETTRRRHGGIRLAKPPAAIDLGAVVRDAEPDMDLAPCFAGTEACVLGRCCLLQGALRRAGQAFAAELGRSMLADLIGPGGPTASMFPARARTHTPEPCRPRAASRPSPAIAGPKAASAMPAPIR
ncbi:MAG TPA: Rrf2 family transcriptional regulator [Acetobacteraceae bacterium]|nr:Rrf2 family transcriptional regulator [Acetobacteraceae bacterium]